VADADDLPTDPEALRALLIAERAQHAAERDRLRAIIMALQRHRFGRRSERLDPDQLALALEELEQSVAVAEAQEEHASASKPTRPSRPRKTFCSPQFGQIAPSAISLYRALGILSHGHSGLDGQAGAAWVRTFPRAPRGRSRSV
jgi:hypothetical protein